MSGGTKLGGYLAALVVVFIAAFGLGRALIPDSAAQRWQEQLDNSTMQHPADNNSHDGAGHGASS